MGVKGDTVCESKVYTYAFACVHLFDHWVVTALKHRQRVIQKLWDGSVTPAWDNAHLISGICSLITGC